MRVFIDPLVTVRSKMKSINTRKAPVIAIGKIINK